MFSYAGWSFLGKTSGTFAGQGVNMVINVVLGPAVNAARSLSGTVNHSVQIFVNNFTMAIWPQISQSYASGDHGYVKDLLFRGTKFTFFIMWFAFLPLVLETPFVVKLWLGTYPDYTIIFIRLSLIANTISILQVVLAMGIRATGKIVWYQISFSALEFLHFGLSYVLLNHGFSPEWSYYCGVVIAVIKVFAMWVLAKNQLSVSISEFLKTVVLPLTITCLVSAAVPSIIHFSMSDGWVRFILTLVSSLIVNALAVLFIGCTSSERKMLTSMVLGKLKSYSL
jgi:O-antigen/teichoic acid export membrane protein